MNAKVYLRDVSWYSSGRGGSAGRYHFLGRDLASKCGRARMLDVDDPNDADYIASSFPSLKCKAKGCRELWPKDQTKGE